MAMITTAPDNQHSDLKRRLMTRHPWHQRMSRSEYWPRLRAVFEGMNDPDVKAMHLVRGEFDKDAHFETRAKLTEFLGVFKGVVGRMVGAVFVREPEVVFDAAAAKPGIGAPEAPSDPVLSELQQFAANVDGMGTSLTEYLEGLSSEAVAMGLVGVFVDQAEATPEARAAFEALQPSERSVEAQKKLGIPRLPRCVRYFAEEIEDWEKDNSGRPLWVKLRRVISRRMDFESARDFIVQFVVIDRVNVTIYEAKATDAGARGKLGMNGLPVLDRLEDIEEPMPPRTVAHGCGRVPFEGLMGESLDLFRAYSPLMGTMRADILALNEDSQGTFSRYLHLVPLLVVKSKKVWKKIVKTVASALHLDPEDGEDVKYVHTESGGFEIGMKSVENRKFEGHRQAGMDAQGLMDSEGKMQAESGVAKAARFGKGEARFLKSLAQQVQNTHFSILEIAARRLAPAPAPIDAVVFPGSVRYRKDFEEEDIDQLINQFSQVRPWTRGAPLFNKTMVRRIVLALLGDASQRDQEAIAKEIDAMKDADVVEPEPMPEEAGFGA